MSGCSPSHTSTPIWANAITRGYRLSAMSGNRMRVLTDALLLPYAPAGHVAGSPTA